jgi:ComF family protein
MRLREPSWPRCQRCHYPVGTGRPEATDCLQCRGWPPELTEARSAFELRAPADDLVHALKYEGWRELAGYMASLMTKTIGPSPSSSVGPSGTIHQRQGARQIVVPVPTTVQRAQARGYNQAELLAEGVAAGLGVPIYAALNREGSQGSQTSLTPRQRHDNVRGAFTLTPSGSLVIRGAQIVLVDDVLTTGATAGEVATTLARGGADKVTLLTFARALSTRPRDAA